MLLQLAKAGILIIFLMLSWLVVAYFNRKSKNLSLNCDLLEETRGCLSCALADKCADNKGHSH